MSPKFERLGSTALTLLNRHQDYSWDSACKQDEVPITTSINSSPQIPVDQFTQNLKSTLAFLQDTQPSAEIILITPSTVDTETWSANGRAQGLPSEFRDNRTTEAAKAIRDAVLAVARDSQVDAVDAWKLHDDAMNSGEIKLQELFSDGLHYSERAYAVSCCLRENTETLTPRSPEQYVAQALLQLIKSKYPSLAPDNTPEGFDMFAAYGNENNPQAQRLAKLFADNAEAIKQAALGNIKV